MLEVKRLWQLFFQMLLVPCGIRSLYFIGPSVYEGQTLHWRSQGSGNCSSRRCWSPAAFSLQHTEAQGDYGHRIWLGAADQTHYVTLGNIYCFITCHVLFAANV